MLLTAWHCSCCRRQDKQQHVRACNVPLAVQWDAKHMSYNFDIRKGPIHTTWFQGGTTNISYNCLDMQVAKGRGDQTCFIWEGNEPRAHLQLCFNLEIWSFSYRVETT